MARIKYYKNKTRTIRSQTITPTLCRLKEANCPDGIGYRYLRLEGKEKAFLGLSLGQLAATRSILGPAKRIVKKKRRRR